MSTEFDRRICRTILALHDYRIVRQPGSAIIRAFICLLDWSMDAGTEYAISNTGSAPEKEDTLGCKSKGKIQNGHIGPDRLIRF